MKTLQNSLGRTGKAVEIMAISNELSSDIAAAILVEKSPTELNKLKDVILRVHSTLQKMSQEERAARTQDITRRSLSRNEVKSA